MLLLEQKELKATIKKEAAALHALTKETIEQLEDSQIYHLLEHKWIVPVVTSLNNLPTGKSRFLSREEYRDLRHFLDSEENGSFK